MIALTFFGAGWRAAKSDFIGLDRCAVADKGHGVGGFDDEDVIGGKCGIGGWISMRASGHEQDDSKEQFQRSHS